MCMRVCRTSPLTRSQISLSSPCASHSATQTHAITDVTRIQEGVAAYYILTAHTRCLARLGSFKRLRLDKQRSFRSLLISSPLWLYLPLSHRCCASSKTSDVPLVCRWEKQGERTHTHKWPRAGLTSQERKSVQNRVG